MIFKTTACDIGFYYTENVNKRNTSFPFLPDETEWYWADRQIICPSLCSAIVVGWWCIQLRKCCLLTQLQVSAGPGLLAPSSRSLHFKRKIAQGVYSGMSDYQSPCVLTLHTLGYNYFAYHKCGFILSFCENYVLGWVGPDFNVLINGKWREVTLEVP